MPRSAADHMLSDRPTKRPEPSWHIAKVGVDARRTRQLITKPRGPSISRHWRRVSKAFQKLAAGLHAVKSEGMFPYETHYVLVTDEELERLYDWGTGDG
jgi:hypothetical protein